MYNKISIHDNDYSKQYSNISKYYCKEDKKKVGKISYLKIKNF